MIPNWDSRKGSRFLDVHAESILGEADTLTKTVLSDYVFPKSEQAKNDLASRKAADNRKEWFRHVQTVIVDALYRHYTHGSEGGLRISRDTSRKRIPKRYTKASGIKQERLIKAVDALCGVGLLECSRPSVRQPMYFRATPELVALAERSGFDVFSHFNRRESEKVELRKKHKPKGKPSFNSLEDYEDNATTEQSREIVERWGLLLASSDIALPSGAKAPPSSFTNLRRIFRLVKGHNPFETYGRVHGWWQNYPEGERLKITFGGLPACEIDIRASILQTAYALATKAQCPMDDAYETELVKMFGYQLRPLAKAAAMRVLGNTTLRAASDSMLRHFQEEEPDNLALLEAFEVTPEAVCADFIQTHKAGIGRFLLKKEIRSLMYWESEVTLRAIDKLTHKRIPVLTTHDSFLCKAEDEKAVRAAVKDAFFEVFGVEILNESRFFKTTYSSLSLRERD